MRINTSQFIHEISTALSGVITGDRTNGSMTIDITFQDGTVIRSFTTPAVGNLTTEQYDDFRTDVIRTVQMLRSASERDIRFHEPDESVL